MPSPKLVFISQLKDATEIRRDIWSRFRVSTFIESFLVFAVTIFAAILLYKIKWLQFSWLSLFHLGFTNVILSPVTGGASSPWGNVFVCVFLICFLLVIPRIAHAEEVSFRRGADRWGEIIPASMHFGLSHCIVGVPIAFGLALSITGFFYACKYRSVFLKLYGHGNSFEYSADEGVMVSTTYHAAYNTLVISIILILCIVCIL